MNGIRDRIPKELQGNLIIKVCPTETIDLVKKIKEQLSTDAQYREPWIIFDRDKVPNFDQIIIDANREGIDVAWSNPCIEEWFMVYFGEIQTLDDSVICCKKFNEMLYKKTKQEYKKNDLNIYNKLLYYGNEEKAIELAKERYNHYLNNGVSNPSEMVGCTTLYLLISEINTKIRNNT